MPFTVNVDKAEIPSSQLVAANTIIQHARNQGSPYAERAVGVTVPTCRTDQTGLQYEQRRASGRIEFRFSTGTLRLTLRQSVYLSNVLSNCHQKIWEAHEQGHVQDNQSLMSNMEREIRNHRALQDVFINPRWRPRREFNALQSLIESTVGGIFQRLTREAVQKRDTQAEYDAIQRRIREKCGSSN